MFRLYPDYEFEKISDLTPGFLSEKGIRALILDYDNTLAPYTLPGPESDVIDWLEEMNTEGIFLIILSNSRKDRAAIFCSKCGIPCITNAGKPFSRNVIKNLLLQYHLEENQTALVGDQIFTDVLAANMSHLVSILVKPIRLHNAFLRIRHCFERPFIYMGRIKRK